MMPNKPVRGFASSNQRCHYHEKKSELGSLGKSAKLTQCTMSSVLECLQDDPEFQQEYYDSTYGLKQTAHCFMLFCRSQTVTILNKAGAIVRVAKTKIAMIPFN